MVPGGRGMIFSVRSDGSLRLYRHTSWLNGTAAWKNPVGDVINFGGWNRFRTVLGSSDGQLFAIRGDGVMQWYRYLVDDVGNGEWSAASTSVIGRHFDRYPRIFGGWDGVIYAIDGDGFLHWFKYLAQDGSTGPDAWAWGGRGARIAEDDWKQLVDVWADEDGVIYATQQGGTLYWFRYLAGDGTNEASAWPTTAKGWRSAAAGTGTGTAARRSSPTPMA